MDVVFKEGDEYVQWKGLHAASTGMDSRAYERWKVRGFHSPWKGPHGLGQVSFEWDAYRAWEADGFPARGEGDRVIDEGDRVLWLRNGVLSWEEQIELDVAWSVQSEGGARRSPRPGRRTWTEVRVEHRGRLARGRRGCPAAGCDSHPRVRSRREADHRRWPGHLHDRKPPARGLPPDSPPLEVVVAAGSHQVCEVQLQRAP